MLEYVYTLYAAAYVPAPAVDYVYTSAYALAWLAVALISLRTHRALPFFTLAAAVQAAQAALMLTGSPTDNAWVNAVWWPSRVALCLALTAAVIESCALITARLPIGIRTIARSAASGTSLFLLVGLGHPNHYFTGAIWVALAAASTIVIPFAYRPSDANTPNRAAFYRAAALLWILTLAHVLVAHASRADWYAAQLAFRLTSISTCAAWSYLTLRAASLNPRHSQPAAFARSEVSAHQWNSATAVRRF